MYFEYKSKINCNLDIVEMRNKWVANFFRFKKFLLLKEKEFYKKIFLTGCFLLVDVLTASLLELSKKSVAVVGFKTSFLGFDLTFFVGQSKSPKSK